jgi:hypothetical protein
VERLRNRTANAGGIQFTRRSVSRSEVLPLRGDGGQRTDHGQLISVRSMIAVKVEKVGAVTKNGEMKTHCRNTALRTLINGLYVLSDQRETCNPLLEC